ncbi:MAG: HEPN domain-containing protein [Perlabentimonas sp.]
MTGYRDDLVRYRIVRAKETLEDAKLLIESKRWNSAINRLYYSAFYVVIALLLNENYKTTTHNGVKSIFSEQFVKKNIISQELGKKYSQLFTWRQKGDYADLFDFTEEKVLPYYDFVKKFILQIEKIINN